MADRAQLINIVREHLSNYINEFLSDDITEAYGISRADRKVVRQDILPNIKFTIKDTSNI